MEAKKRLRLVLVFVGFIIALLFLTSTFRGAAEASAAPSLGTAGTFAVLGAAVVNDTNPSVITGNVGLSPAAWPPSPALTCGEVTGTIYSVDASGPSPCRITNPGLLTTAKGDLTNAYNDAAGRSATTIATELGGVTLLDGVYVSASTTFQISTSATLTLNGNGNPDSVFIFKMASDAASLVTGSNSKVVLTNGAQACNVFWQVGGSATLGPGTSFVGNVMADQSITDNGGSSVNGRFLARIAAVTLNDTTISRPACTTATNTPTNTRTRTPTRTRTNTRTRTPTRTATVTQTVTPTNTPTNPPTAVNVTSFKGRLNARGQVLVSWHTVSESQIAGFRVYRQRANNKWLVASQNFIPAKHAGDLRGDKYRFSDKHTQAHKVYHYKIQILYLDNHIEWTNSIEVKTP